MEISVAKQLRRSFYHHVHVFYMKMNLSSGLWSDAVQFRLIYCGVFWVHSNNVGIKVEWIHEGLVFLINNLCITRNPITLFSFLFVPLSSCDFCVGTKFMCSQVIAPIKNEAGEVCMYILNFEDCDALPDAPNSAEHSTTVRFSKCNCIFSSINLRFLFRTLFSLFTFNSLITICIVAQFSILISFLLLLVARAF